MGFVQDRGLELAAELDAAGVAATADPAQAVGLAPCVLVGPPSQEARHYGGRVVSWRLIVLSSTADPAQAWDQLDDLLDALAAVIPWERADPTAYTLATGTEAVPAYAVTYTETVTED